MLNITQRFRQRALPHASTERRTTRKGQTNRRTWLGTVERLEDRVMLATYTVNTRFDIVDAADEYTSLREALVAANDEVLSPGHDSINFDPALTYQTVLVDIAGFDDVTGDAIPVSLGELVISSDITIDATAAGLVRIGRDIGDEAFLESARLDHRVLKVESGEVELTNVIIQRGQTAAGEYGAGIFNAGNLTLRGSIVGDNIQRLDNSADRIFGGGGGIYNGPTGTLSLINSTVGSTELDAEALASLGLDPADFPTDDNGQPLLIPGNVAEGPGGGIFNEGMIGDPNVEETIGISADSSVSFNRSDMQGGGIFNAGVLKIADSLIGDNTAATFAEGGGIHSSEAIPRGDNDTEIAPGPVTVTIANSTVKGNRAGNGGGIYVGANTELLVTESTFTENTADTGPLGDGGAIDNDGTTTIVRSTIWNNVGEQNGGGIHSTGTLTLTSSTVSTNGVLGGVATATGGGVYIAGGTAEVRDSTITLNQATGSSGGIRNIGVLNLDNTILAMNSAGVNSPNGRNTGTITASNSLIDDNSSSQGPFMPSGNGNLIGVDPLLGPLGDHGGPTLTHGLLAGSPAINSSYTTLGGGDPETDQRGVNRIIGPAADRGAFESEPPQGMRVDSLSDEVNGYYGPGDFTLREAVLWAAQVPGPNTIGFSRGLTRLLESRDPQDPLLLELTNGEIVIDQDLTIRGPGAQLLPITADLQSRIFLITANANVEISGLTLTEGSAQSGSGGAIRNDGALTLKETVVSASVAGIGGGIHNSGTLILDATHVVGNRANSGGGIYNAATATIVDSTISENVATGQGGGILVALRDQLTVTNSTISSNRADASGGGIYFEGAAIGDLNYVTITNNFAAESENINSLTEGGGIWATTSAANGNSIVTLNSSIVWGNFSNRSPHDVQEPVAAASSFNLIGVGGGLVDGQNGNQVGVLSALLGPLRLAGGPTPTHALRPGSPAIDAADPIDFPPTDQRGFMRPVDDPNVDVGGSGSIVNLAQVHAVTTNVSSSFPNFGPERAIDGDLSTSWFTANGDAANLGTTPFYEVIFPEDVTVNQINMRGNREFATGFDFFQGRFDVFDVGDNLLYSQVIALPAPDRDIDLDIPDQTNVRRVRFTGLADESVDPGFAELEILGPFGPDETVGPADIGAYEYVPPNLPNPIVVDTLSGISDGVYGPGEVSLGDAVALANSSTTYSEIVFDPQLFIDSGEAAQPAADEIINLVQALPVTAKASSSFGGNEPEDAIDGDLATSWFTVSGDAANLGKSPFFEVIFPDDVLTTGITMRSTRTSTDADFIQGRFDLFDAAGVVLYSEVVDLPDTGLLAEDRDFFLDIPDQQGVRRVRFTSLDDEKPSNGFAELEVYGTAGVIGLGGEELVISSDLIITGPGADLLKISGTRQNRLFRIEGAPGVDPTVTISGVTLTSGRLPVNSGEDANGGAIWNSGDLTLDSVYVANNSIEEYRFEIAGRGGAIYNEGTLTLNNTTLARNTTVNDGGAIYNAGTLSTLNSTFSTNAASPHPAAGTSLEPDGGAIFNAAGAVATLSYTTITRNTALGLNASGGGIYNAGTLDLDNTIVAENDAFSIFGDDGRNVGTAISNGTNIVGNNDNFNLTPTFGDQFGSAGGLTDPLLTDLISIGGGIPMHGLLPTSPAVDAGNPVGVPATDQRGVSRPVGTLPDVGAFELEGFTWESELVVDSFSDVLDAVYGLGSLTLREAILWSNAQDGTAVTDGIDRITFDPAMIELLSGGDLGTNTLILNGKQLTITGDLFIEDPGSVLAEPVPGEEIFRISGDDKSRVLRVESGASVEIHGLTFADGKPPGSEAFPEGGGILNLGNLLLRHTIVEDSFAQNEGGGIYNGDGSLTVIESTIRRNTTNGNGGFGGGGGIHNEGGVLDVVASTIADNLAGSVNTNQGSGGGIQHFGPTATISRSAIYGNRAQDDGGGIRVGFQSAITIDNTTISSNETLKIASAAKGGGIHSIGDVNVTNTTIAGNISRGSSGGGGFYAEGGSFRIANTIVATNDHDSGSDTRDEGYVGSTVAFESAGRNLFGRSPLLFGSNVLHPDDIIDPDPGLGPLADNGGRTRTHVLKASSPAIDAGRSSAVLNGEQVNLLPLTDQRGRPMVDVPDDQLSTDGDFDIPDIGAYEVQGVGVAAWQYDALDRSQFGEGAALVYGFGFDEGVPNSSVNPDPFFLGFQFDTGPQKAGGIAEGLFGTKFGGEIEWDFSGKLGFDLGFYINSGSVDVTYDGNLNYVIDNYPTGDKASVSAFVDIDDGSLFTVSPKIGAYADLVIELNADVSVTGCLFGCIGADLLNIHFNVTEELFAVNRQMMDDVGRPLFFDLLGNAFARDSATGNFLDLDGVPVSVELQQQLETEGVLPIFDGEIRYFSLGLDKIVEGVEETINLKKRVDALRSGGSLYEANRDLTKATNRVEQNEESLRKAKEMRDNADTAADVIRANREIERLEGRDGNSGELKDARDSQAQAQQKQEKKKGDFQDKAGKARRTVKSPKSLVGVSFGEAEGSLLGAQADLEVGFGVNGADIAKKVGTLQVTLPDVNLVDPTPDASGALYATTASFPKQSELDFKRQIAKASIDLAALLPFPGGKYELNLGPLSIGVTTVSYNFGPQLNVTQNVAAVPVAKEIEYLFFEVERDGNGDPVRGMDGELLPDVTAPVEVLVSVDGVAEFDAGGGFDGRTDTVDTVQFDASSRVVIETGGTAFDGEVVFVMPTLTMDARFTNDIGLDIDLEAVFEAFALNFSAFGIDIVDIGPLIRHQQTLATFDIGSVFNRTFDLQEKTIPLPSFTLFDQTMDGRTVATAFMTEPTIVPDVADVAIGAVPAGPPVFVASELVDPANPDQLFTVLDVVVTGTATVDSLRTLDERLTVTPTGPPGAFQITGFTQRILRERSSALFALTFSSPGSATVTTTRSNASNLVQPPDTDAQNMGVVLGEVFEQAGTSAVLTNDIDGDGLVSPLTDGVLLVRHLDGVTGPAMTAGALGASATRTTPEAIAAFIDDLLDRSYLDGGLQLSTLDLDGSGGSPQALEDGILLARYMAGFGGDALVAGAVDPLGLRTTGSAIVDFIEIGRASVSDPDTGEFTKVLDRTGFDLLGVDGVLDADANAADGSSASAPVDPDAGVPASGSSPEFAAGPTAYFAGELLASFDFALANYGQSVMFEEVYLDGVLISRVAEGSPLDFGGDAYRDLISTGVTSEQLTTQMGTANLGQSEPIFVQAPDAVAYEYSAFDGYAFDSITIDPQVGGNLFLPSEFDLYLLNGGTWEFSAAISGDNPAQVGPNGFLVYQFPAGPVTEFRLYSRALPNDDLHDASNAAAPELFTTTGFILSGGSGTPTVRMTQLAERMLFSAPDAIRVDFPVHSDDTSAVTTTFTLVRSGADVLPSIVTSGAGVVPTIDPIQMATASEISIVGDDNVEDTLVIDASGGPVQAPIRFFGGFLSDALVIDGAGIEIDLIDRDALAEVEVVDIRGTGSNTLIVNVDAVRANDPITRTLQVVGDADDTLTIDAGWSIEGTELIDGATYDRYQQDGATLLVSQETSVVVESPAAGEMVSSGMTVGGVVAGGGTQEALSTDTALLPIGNVEVTFADPPAPLFGTLSHGGGSQQIVTATVSAGTAAAGQPLTVSVDYATDAMAATTGLHLRMHFDSSQLTLDSLSDLLPTGFSSEDVQSEPDCGSAVCGGFDGDPNTDVYVNVLWIATAGDWPAAEPARLLTANFTVAETFTNQTQINFSGNAAAGFLLVAPSVPFNAPQFVGDMDFDGDVDFDDISDFVLGFVDPVAYENVYGRPPSANGDIDLDGDQDFDDIGGFVAILSSPSLAGGYQDHVEAAFSSEATGSRLEGDTSGAMEEADQVRLPADVRLGALRFTQLGTHQTSRTDAPTPVLAADRGNQQPAYVDLAIAGRTVRDGTIASELRRWRPKTHDHARGSASESELLEIWSPDRQWFQDDRWAWLA